MVKLVKKTVRKKQHAVYQEYPPSILTSSNGIATLNPNHRRPRKGYNMPFNKEKHYIPKQFIQQLELMLTSFPRNTPLANTK
jgi:hypothetical protein